MDEGIYEGRGIKDCWERGGGGELIDGREKDGKKGLLGEGRMERKDSWEMGEKKDCWERGRE